MAELSKAKAEEKEWCQKMAPAVKQLVAELREEGADIVGHRINPNDNAITIIYNDPRDVEAIPEEFEGVKVIAIEFRPQERVMINKLKEHMPELQKLLEECQSHWGYEDTIYRFYHHSFKVYGRAQGKTKAIVKLLKLVSPFSEEEWEVKSRFNKSYQRILDEGLGHTFEMNHNQEWDKRARPMIEAFFHSKFFLEMAVKYGQELDRPQQCLPSGWATFLYLYNMR